ETNDLVSRWLLLSSENSSKLSEVGAEVIYVGKPSFLGLVRGSLGSDAWSYDLGTSGIRNVIACGKNVNVLIIGHAAKDASRRKKDIGLYAMNYSNSYVASIAVYSSYTQTLQAFIEADKFTGPSIITQSVPSMSTRVVYKP
ncbi:hypothetical protein V1504DRAFT_437052, partial [Lipomyces starkeyi]